MRAYTRARRGPAAPRLAGGCLETVGLLEDVRAVINEEIDVAGDPGRWLTMMSTPAEDGDLETFQGHQL